MTDAVEQALLAAARLEPGQDVLVLGGQLLALGAHERVGDGSEPLASDRPSNAGG